MKRNLYCVIMAGGGGNTFWPVTRENRPQHFLENYLIADCSFLRGTFDRFAEVVPKENILVVTLSKYELLVRRDLPELPSQNILLEPFPRKTAACIAYAACVIRQRDPGAIMIATPADHIIQKGPLFAETLRKVAACVEDNDVLMTLGIVPTGPDTEYGYIQAQGGREALSSGDPMPVKTFTEKPDASLAEVFYGSGEFFWNAGIFIWRNETIISEICRYVPYLVPMLEGWPEVAGTDREETFLARAYADCEKQSIDYAVMEKTDKAWLYPVQFGWADIGSWDALCRSISDLEDPEGNILLPEHTYLKSASGNLLLSDNPKKLIAVEGLRDYMVIDTGDVLMVCPRDDRRYRDFVSGIALPGFEEYR